MIYIAVDRLLAICRYFNCRSMRGLMVDNRCSFKAQLFPNLMLIL